MVKKHQSMTRAVNLQNQRLMASISDMENELVQMDRAEESFMDKNSPHNKPINANLDHSKEFVAEIDSADPEQEKLANSHKETLEELQDQFDNAEEKKARLVRKWEKERQEFNKTKTKLNRKHYSARNNAQFTGYGIIGLFALLSFVSFCFSNRYGA